MTRLALVVLVLAACSKEGSKGGGADEDKGPRAGEVKEPPPPPPAPEDPKDIIAALDTYDDAMRMALPVMSDSVDEISPGAILFTAWAARKMRWADVAVAKNETSLKLVRKDGDEARGKRLCASGRIGEIEKISSDPKVFTGGLIAGWTDVYRFLAVGSTGELVGESRARFCGVVVGQYDYSNTGGGQTKSVMLVGMFDLPQNKPPAPTKP
jgi:hypothetical protein